MDNELIPSGGYCPECGGKIGALVSLKAPLPNRMRCDLCKAKIGYVGNYWFEYLVCSGFFAVLIAAIGYIAIPFSVSVGVPFKVLLLAYTFICIFLWLVIGYLLSLYLIRTKVLFVRKGR